MGGHQVNADMGEQQQVPEVEMQNEEDKQINTKQYNNSGMFSAAKSMTRKG